MDKKDKINLDEALAKIAARLRPEAAFDKEHEEELLTCNTGTS